MACRPSVLRRLLAVVLLPASLMACDDDPLGPRSPEDVRFDESLGIDLSAMERLPSGVYVETLESGEGGGITTGEVEVTYTLWLPNGTQVDAGTFSFTFGEDQVIPGFEIGVSGMQVGELRRIIVPSELAYGAQGSGSIPAHSVLVFEVRLDSAAVTIPS